jgi:hypothetical protein
MMDRRYSWDSTLWDDGSTVVQSLPQLSLKCSIARNGTTMKIKLPSLLLASLLLSACGTTVVNPVSGQAERSVMDERTEIAEGAKGHQQVLQEYGVYNNPGGAILCQCAGSAPGGPVPPQATAMALHRARHADH